MDLILIFIFAFVVVAILLGRKKTFRPPSSTMADPAIFQHYELQDSLFVNRSELAFFHALNRALPAGFYLLTKPRLEDVIGVKRDLNPKVKFHLRGRVKSRHVDFLVIDGDGRPHCAVELDGTSHQSKSAAAGDHLKDGICKAAGLALRRVKVGEDFHQAAQNIIGDLSP